MSSPPWYCMLYAPVKLAHYHFRLKHLALEQVFVGVARAAAVVVSGCGPDAPAAGGLMDAPPLHARPGCRRSAAASGALAAAAAATAMLRDLGFVGGRGVERRGGVCGSSGRVPLCVRAASAKALPTPCLQPRITHHRTHTTPLHQTSTMERLHGCFGTLVVAREEWMPCLRGCMACS